MGFWQWGQAQPSYSKTLRKSSEQRRSSALALVARRSSACTRFSAARASRSASVEVGTFGTTSDRQAAFPARTPAHSIWFACGGDDHARPCSPRDPDHLSHSVPPHGQAHLLRDVVRVREECDAPGSVPCDRSLEVRDLSEGPVVHRDVVPVAGKLCRRDQQSERRMWLLFGRGPGVEREVQAVREEEVGQGSGVTCGLEGAWGRRPSVPRRPVGLRRLPAVDRDGRGRRAAAR